MEQARARVRSSLVYFIGKQNSWTDKRGEEEENEEERGFQKGPAADLPGSLMTASVAAECL